MEKVLIYIGYDSREHIAAEVCKYSIETRSNLKCNFLKSKEISNYGRCVIEPQSTDFTFSRFWVPYLSNYTGYSMFVDCDFLFLDDVQILFDIAKNNRSAVSVVKHSEYTPKTNIKMDNIPQHRSFRKNWASLMIFDNTKCKHLTPDYLYNVNPGIHLHHFNWIEDKEIGELPLEWNTLDGYYDIKDPKAIHYTDGGPWFDNYKTTQYSDIWITEYNKWKK